MRKRSIIVAILLWMLMLTGCLISEPPGENKNVDESRSSAQTTSTREDSDNETTEGTETE